jgi:hypothetical protein
MDFLQKPCTKEIQGVIMCVEVSWLMEASRDKKSKIRLIDVGFVVTTTKIELQCLRARA